MKKPVQPTGGIVNRDRYDYSTQRMVHPVTGRVQSRVSNGDAVATAMMHLTTPEALAKVIKVNKLAGKITDGPDAFSNFGQYRMNIGNALRKRVRDFVAKKDGAEAPTIGEHVVKKLDQNVPIPAGVKEAEKRTSERLKEREKAAATKDKTAAKDKPKAVRKTKAEASANA